MEGLQLKQLTVRADLGSMTFAYDRLYATFVVHADPVTQKS